MSKLIYGNRVAKHGRLSPGATAIIFDENWGKVLLTQRSDNGRWCLPGGSMDAGESAQETCVRETMEETGLQVCVTKLVGVYTNPNLGVEYDDGHRLQPIAMSFEAVITGGELNLSDETIAYGYFSVDNLGDLDLMEHYLERIQEAAANLPSAFIK